MEEFKVEGRNTHLIVTYSQTSDSSCFNMRKTYKNWLLSNLFNFITFKFKYVPLYVVKNLRGYSIDDMEIIYVDEDNYIFRFDKCCKKQENN